MISFGRRHKVVIERDKCKGWMEKSCLMTWHVSIKMFALHFMKLKISVWFFFTLVLFNNKNLIIKKIYTLWWLLIQFPIHCPLASFLLHKNLEMCQTAFVSQCSLCKSGSTDYRHQHEFRMQRAVKQRASTVWLLLKHKMVQSGGRAATAMARQLQVM